MPLLHFSAADWIVFGIYIVFLLYIGFRGSKSSRATADNFILGGRLLTLPAFVAALVSTWYGGILGVGEFSYLYGLANWIVFGVPYYVFAVIFSVFFARRVRESALYSIPDKFYRTYDRKTGLLGSILVFFISSPAPYFLMLAILLQVITGWSFLPCLIMGGIISVAYVYAGGFRAVVRTDLLQFGLMFGGFLLLLIFLIPQYGFLSYLADNVPKDHLTITGGHTIQYILVWFFIALWTLVAPQFHQFTLSARTPRTAKRGILVSVLFWIFFDGVTTLSGLYARALLPSLSQPSMSYPLLADMILPSIAKGLFYIGMLATVMSTLDSLTFIAAITVGRDIFAQFSKRSDDSAINRFIQIGVLITAVSATAGALLFPSVIRLWYVVGMLFIPGILLPLVTSYYERFKIPPTPTFLSMLAGFLFSVLSFVWGEMRSINGQAQYPFGIEPMYPGLAITFVIYGVVIIWKKYIRMDISA